MKTTLLKKNVAALVLATVLTTPVLAQGLTDGSIPCQDVASNEEAYGCGMGDENATNRKYKCLKALSQFEVPMSQESNDFRKPGKIKKGDKMVAVGKNDGSIVFGDDEKNFKISKEKIKEAIDAKYGALAAAKEKFKVTFQTLKGKITLAFKKKQGEQGGYDIGKWEKTQESSDSNENVLVTLGNQAHQDAQSSNALQNMSQSLDDKVTSFPAKVDQKVEEIEQKYEEKKDQVDQNSELTTMEKIAMKRNLDQEKLSKKEIWLRKKRNAAQMRAHALRKCMGQGQLISESTLRSGTNSSGGVQQSLIGSVSQ